MSDTNAQSIAFVRKTEIPPSPPPASETGVLKWIREKLFSDVFNAILTLLALYFIYKLAAAAVPWFVNGVWDADNIRECRKILDDKTGACFAVLADRWNQLVFGLKYPPNQYWRPVFAFVLMLLAAAPALFSALPRKLLVFTALYPFVGYWLIWGGSAWVPIVILLSIAATYLIFKGINGLVVSARKVLAAIAGIISGLALAYLLFSGARELIFVANSVGNAGALATVAYLLFWAMAIFAFVFCLPMGAFIGYTIYQSAENGGLVTIVTSLVAFYVMMAYGLGPVSDALNDIIPIELRKISSRNMGGFLLNMILGTVCVSLSVPLGILLALGRQSSMPLIKGICVVFIEFIRGVPLITLLFVANVMLGYFLPPETNFDLILRVIIMMTLFSSAYIAEVIRGGLAALPKGQYEAADSLGLNYAQATRLVILPQALKISIPGIVNVAVGLFKDTTLVSVISMFDLVGLIRGPIQQSTDWLGIYWELFGAAALMFFVVCYTISQYSQWLERQLATDHH